MSNNQAVSVPPYIGLEPLVGRYYPAQCRRCGWVGSSEELTEDDAQCTRDVGDRLCLGDCDELERHDLLSIIQAMAEQHQGEPVAEVEIGFNRFNDTGEGLFVKWLLPDGAPLPAGTKLYTHAGPAEVERLREQVKTLRLMTNDYLVETERLRAQLAERDALVGAIAGWTTETRAAVLEAFQDELHESASYAWYDAAIVDLMKLVEALSASAEPSAPVELKAPELTEDLREILGRPNFTCHFIAKALRVMGHSIAHKSEDEQAAVIHWLLGIYLKHGSD